MEPMALGSPVGSPVQIPGSPGNNSAYLPGFLLGDTNTSARLGVMSPQETPRYLNTSNTMLASPITHYGTPECRINRQKAVFGNATNLNTQQFGTECQAGGPPRRGLFDSLDTSQSLMPLSSPTNQNLVTSNSNQSRLLMNNSSNLLFPDTPLNTNESQGLLQWVTVFGFPMSAINTVLSHISSRIRIVDKHSAPHSESNWIHLKCASEQEAQRALACNGSIVSGSIMIGVIPCTDEGVILGCDKENRAKLNGSMRSFAIAGKTGQPVSDNNLPRTPVRIQSARPLASGYNQHLSPQSVRSPENVPQKSTGLISKAMEYVFGW